MKKYCLVLLSAILITTSTFGQIGNIVIPDGHAVGIEKMLLSPDGKYLYTANNQKIIMWDVKQHIQLYSFNLAVEMSFTQALHSFILSNDGKYVAAAGAFGVKCFSTVTGKSVLNIDRLHYSATFSADSKKIYFTGEMQDPKTYNRLVGILSVDLVSLESQPVFICTDYGNCNFKDFKALKNGRVMLWHKTGWQIADLDAKKILFTADVETKTTRFGSVTDKFFLPIANTNLIVATEQKKGEINSQLIFYDAFSGKQILSKKNGVDWKVLPAMEGNTILLDAGRFTDELEWIDINNGTTIKKITKSSLGLEEGNNLSTGIVYSKKKQIFFNIAGDVQELDLQTLKSATNFKREIAGFPIVNNYEHNEQTQQLRIVTDYTNYLSIDLKRMVVEKNVLLNNTANQNTEINFSNSGDTLSVDDYGKAFFYAIKNGKKTVISPTLFGKSPFQSDPRPNLFFGKEGKFAYAIKNIGDRSDVQILYQINIATNINKKIAEFHHNLEIDIHQDLLIGYDKTATGFLVKCWQLASGKLVFSKNIPKQGEEPKLITAKVFDNASKIAVLGLRHLNVFQMGDGKIIRSTEEALYSLENKYIISHNASSISELNYTGVISIKDSSLNQKQFIQAHDGSIIVHIANGCSGPASQAALRRRGHQGFRSNRPPAPATWRGPPPPPSPPAGCGGRGQRR